jgi:pyrroline-5-carboxylate reductase
MKSMNNITVGFIGTGAMGSALVKAARRVIDGKRIFITSRSFEKHIRIAAELGVEYTDSNVSLVSLSDIVFIAVKPAQVPDVLHEIAPHCEGKTLVSMVAGVTLDSIRAMLSGPPPEALIRIMPNIAASVGEGMTAITYDNDLLETEDAVTMVRYLLEPSGIVKYVDEALMDCVTAVSGSGPAYAFIFIEALADAAVSLGMSRNTAYIFAAQTLKGASKLALESDLHPASLKDMVCSPAGTTIEAVRVLEAGGFRSAIIEAARSAAKKAATG